MASKSIQPEILKLQQRSAAARSIIGRDVLRLKQQLDVPSRIKAALREKPTQWLVGTTAIGISSALLLPLFRRRKSSRRPEKSKAGSRTLQFVWKIGGPILKQWLAKTLAKSLSRPTQVK